MGLERLVEGQSNYVRKHGMGFYVYNRICFNVSLPDCWMLLLKSKPLKMLSTILVKRCVKM